MYSELYFYLFIFIFLNSSKTNSLQTYHDHTYIHDAKDLIIGIAECAMMPRYRGKTKLYSEESIVHSKIYAPSDSSYIEKYALLRISFCHTFRSMIGMSLRRL